MLSRYHALLVLLQVLPTSNVAQFFRQQQAVATHSHWQLLQLAPTAVPGCLKMWALADNRLYCIPLRVPRRIIINSTKSRAQLQADQGPAAALLLQLKGTKAVLPPGDLARHLYEVKGVLSATT